MRHPLVDQFWRAVKSKHMNERDVAAVSGVSKRAIESWLYDGRHPGIGNFVAALEAVGLTLKIVPLERKDGDR